VDAPPASPRAARAPAQGYTTVAKALHWLTVTAIVAQFTVGYWMDGGGGRGRGRGRGRGGESGHGRGRGGGGDDLDLLDGGLTTVHVALGVTILVLAVVRLWWRRRQGLPPWAPTLSARERVLAHWTERVLYVLLFAVPLSGLWLVLVSDDAVGVHVASHVVLFAALAAHLGLVLKHQLVQRDGLVRRML
jgi:cytochrome b561